MINIFNKIIVWRHHQQISCFAQLDWSNLSLKNLLERWKWYRHVYSHLSFQSHLWLRECCFLIRLFQMISILLCLENIGLLLGHRNRSLHGCDCRMKSCWSGSNGIQTGSISFGRPFQFCFFHYKSHSFSRKKHFLNVHLTQIGSIFWYYPFQFGCVFAQLHSFFQKKSFQSGLNFHEIKIGLIFCGPPFQFCFFRAKFHFFFQKKSFQYGLIFQQNAQFHSYFHFSCWKIDFFFHEIQFHSIFYGYHHFLKHP